MRFVHRSFVMKREVEDQLFRIGLVMSAAGIGIGVLYYLFLYGRLPQIPCFFSAVMGIYCPGCGGTRAVIALLQGHFLKAVWYHPLVPYGVVIMVGFMSTQFLHRLGVKGIHGWKFHLWYLQGAVILTGCNFLIKNMLRLIWGITM